MSGLRFSRFSSVAQMLAFTSCSETIAGMQLQNQNVKSDAWGKGRVFERAFWALVGVRLACVKFNRNSVLVLMWHLRCESPQWTVVYLMRSTVQITKRNKELRHAENKICLLQDRFMADLALRIQSAGSWLHCAVSLCTAIKPSTFSVKTPALHTSVIKRFTWI